MEKWERIEVKILHPFIFIRKTELGESMCYVVMYKNIRIARLFCNGIVEFTNREKWKDGWEFRFEFDDDENKQFYKRR